jgi:primary-amine oxidase
MMRNPRLILSAICIHEEDVPEAFRFPARSALRPAACAAWSSPPSPRSATTNIGYRYLFQDGTIEFEMKATGVINTTACNSRHQRNTARSRPGLSVL